MSFVSAPMVSSENGAWQTPACVLDRVRQVAPIALDPCTMTDNPTRATRFCVPPQMSPEPDGLTADWSALAAGGLVYCNPPYGRGISDWLKRCQFAAWTGSAEVIALVPARTDTAWWNDYCAPPASDAVCFWRGRLKFVGAPSSAPFPSALVYWGARRSAFLAAFQDVGALWQVSAAEKLASGIPGYGLEER